MHSLTSELPGHSVCYMPLRSAGRKSLLYLSKGLQFHVANDHLVYPPGWNNWLCYTLDSCLLSQYGGPCVVQQI